jgi:hypothetical protein
LFTECVVVCACRRLTRLDRIFIVPKSAKAELFGPASDSPNSAKGGAQYTTALAAGYAIGASSDEARSSRSGGSWVGQGKNVPLSEARSCWVEAVTASVHWIKQRSF